MPIRTIVWGENVHEKENPIVRGIYPDGMHATIASALNETKAISATTATLQEHEHGLTKAVLPRRTCLCGGAMPPTARWRMPSSTGSSSVSGKEWA